ncbi:MAG TPA: hypothetical protein VK631_19850 [Solirubrobacteraceae bacterium]|nr:hypothetical protein [Solirubrobacteraceae bacterium]
MSERYRCIVADPPWPFQQTYGVPPLARAVLGELVEPIAMQEAA